MAQSSLPLFALFAFILIEFSLCIRKEKALFDDVKYMQSLSVNLESWCDFNSVIYSYEQCNEGTYLMEMKRKRLLLSAAPTIGSRISKPEAVTHSTADFFQLFDDYVVKRK